MLSTPDDTSQSYDSIVQLSTNTYSTDDTRCHRECLAGTPDWKRHSHASSAGSSLDVIIPAPGSAGGSFSSGIDQQIPAASSSATESSTYLHNSNGEHSTSSTDGLDRNIPIAGVTHQQKYADDVISSTSVYGSTSHDVTQPYTTVRESGSDYDLELTPVIGRKGFQALSRDNNTIDNRSLTVHCGTTNSQQNTAPHYNTT